MLLVFFSVEGILIKSFLSSMGLIHYIVLASQILSSVTFKLWIAFEKFIPDAMIHDLDDRLYYFSSEINLKNLLISVMIITVKLRLI